MISLLLLGFLLGMRHALEADHVAAIASLATQNYSLKAAVRQGAAWGMGHTLTLMLFGSVVIWMNSVIPEQLAQILEFTVGVMLVLLGFDVMRRLIKTRIHFHSHSHKSGETHFHAHSHAGEMQHNPILHHHKHSHRFPFRALFIGLMHGMAGSAALILLTLDTVQSPALAMVYIALFGTGSILGMALLSTAIAIPLRNSANGLTRFHNGLQLTVSVATIILGSLLIYDNSMI